MDELRVADAITEIFTLFKRCNKYIDETMPWALAKDEAKKDRLETVLYNLIESITHRSQTCWSPSCRNSEDSGQLMQEDLWQHDCLAYESEQGDREAGDPVCQSLDLEEVMKKVEELHPQQQEEEAEGRRKKTVIDIEAKARDHL